MNTESPQHSTGAPHRLWSTAVRRTGPVAVAALALTGLTALAAPAANAAGATNLIVTSGGDGVTPGADCASGTGSTCTLQDAIVAANALTTSTADSAKITFAPAVTTVQSVEADAMSTTLIDNTDNISVNGVQYVIRSGVPVTIDFGGTVSVLSDNDEWKTEFAIESDDVTLENFVNIRGGEAAFAVAADNATIRNGGCNDDTVMMEACIGVPNGVVAADGSVSAYTGNAIKNLTISNIQTNRAFGGYGLKVADGSSVDGLNVTDSTFSSPGMAVYLMDQTAVSNATFSKNTFEERDQAFYLAGSATTDTFTIDDNTFTNVRNIWDDEATTVDTVQKDFTFTNNTVTGGVWQQLYLHNSTYDGAQVTGNSFTDYAHDGTTVIWLGRPNNGAPSVVKDNTFTQTGGTTAAPVTRNVWAVYADMIVADNKATTPTGWSVVDNAIKGMQSANAPITFNGRGVLPVRGNTFDADTKGTAEPVQSEWNYGWFTQNSGDVANGRLMTWIPTDAQFGGGKVRFNASSTDVWDASQTQTAGPVTLDVYWTAADHAEEYLGQITGVTDGKRVAIATSHDNGFIRVQTVDQATGQTSQYSRLAEVTADTTAPAKPVITGASPIAGTGEAGATVTVVDQNGKTLCTTTVADDGSWSCGAAVKVDCSTTLTATQTDANGNESDVSDAFTDPKCSTDADHDGLTLAQEQKLGTNPNKADTDGDGLKDGVEVDSKFAGCATGTNPRKADTDHDGLKDGAEVRGFNLTEKVRTRKHGKVHNRKIGHVSTNPCKADTDGDGLRDKREIRGFTIKHKVKRIYKARHGKHRIGNYRIGHVSTNPTVKDTDHDGLTDKQEVTGSANKRHHRHKSDPTNFDTDFGGVSDSGEIRAKADPTNVRSGPKHPDRVNRGVAG